MQTVAIIMAAGQGRRMKSRTPKPFMLLKGKPILAHTITAFEYCHLIDGIVVVVPRGYERQCLIKVVKKYGFKKVTAIIRGGRQRQDSVYAALRHLASDCRTVAIHDGVRPFIPVRIIEKGIRQCRRDQAVVTAVPVKDTIKEVVGRKVRITLEREELWQVQTPQLFSRQLIERAYHQAMKDRFYATDDALLVERLKHKVTVVGGTYNNIKITTPEDLALAEFILARREA